MAKRWHQVEACIVFQLTRPQVGDGKIDTWSSETDLGMLQTVPWLEADTFIFKYVSCYRSSQSVGLRRSGCALSALQSVMMAGEQDF